MRNFEMISVNYAEPHFSRTQQLYKAHPEVQSLVGNVPFTALFVFLIVGLQVVIGASAYALPWWGVILAGYTIGAVCNHALWVLTHEATHNLIFKKGPANRLMAILANLPIIFPSAMSFRNFHLKHHQYQGELDRDADLPRPFEVKLVKNSALRKSIWHFFYFVPQLVRVPFLKGIQLFSWWIALNWVVEVSFLVGMVYLTGWNSFLYFAYASIFSIGFHPLGARWIQEHYVVHENQETYSYYGPLNKIAFNVGYHNEHHDMMGIPWTRLPKLKKMAPELYDSLYSHSSWTSLWIRFLTDSQLGLFSRVTRPSPGSLRAKAAGASSRS